ncbi:hypothetical protein K439DRAFT_1622386 [Ramaria rubella]|nr:hypothetical protein K439DRAFT_1622386 [Ramaria rubella]
MLSFDSEAMLPLLLVKRLKHQYVAEAQIHHVVKLPTPACLRGALLVLYKAVYTSHLCNLAPLSAGRRSVCTRVLQLHLQPKHHRSGISVDSFRAFISAPTHLLLVAIHTTSPPKTFFQNPARHWPLGHSHNRVTIQDGNGPEVASEQGLQFFDKPWKDSQFGGVEVNCLLGVHTHDLIVFKFQQDAEAHHHFRVLST